MVRIRFHSLSTRQCGRAKALVAASGTFSPAKPFTVVLFLHGWQLPDFTQTTQIGYIPPQVASSQANALLLAPRLGPRSQKGDSQSGRFEQPDALYDFVAEALQKLTKLGFSQADADLALRSFAEPVPDPPQRAPPVVVSFSGGSHTLPFILSLENSPKTVVRLEGLLLLDSLYSDSEAALFPLLTSESFRRRWFVSLYSEGGQCRPANQDLMKRLTDRKISFFEGNNDWPKIAAPAGTTKVDVCAPRAISFVETKGGHADCLSRGPPEGPVREILKKLAAPHAKSGRETETSDAGRVS